MAQSDENEFDPTLDEDIAPAPKPAATATSLEERLTQAIEALASRADEGPIKQIPLPKAKLRTPWNPSGQRLGRPKLTRNTFMNGNMLREVLLSNEEIHLLNQVKAGRYLQGKVVVNEVHADKGKDEVEIRVANKTIEDRIAQAQFAPDMATLLTRILAEAAERAA